MNAKIDDNDLFNASHLMIIKSYTIFCSVLIFESLLLGWEKWALILIVLALSISWTLHIKKIFSNYVRLWIYSFLMMLTYFFYGMHLTSTFDLAIVTAAVIIIFIMTGDKNLVILCQFTYYLTFVLDLIKMIRLGAIIDRLFITRSLLHLGMVTMIGWVGITIIRRWQEVLDKSHREIEALKDATERFNDILVNVSHELRTPINAIKGISEFCMNNVSDPELKKDISEINDAGRRIGNQIEDIIDYSEIDRNTLVNNFEDYRLSELMNSLTKELKKELSRNVELIVDYDPDIPEVLNSDPDKVKKILWHLAENGIKYTSKGSVSLKLSGKKNGDIFNLLVLVEDTGIGFDDEQKEKIFNAYYQKESGRTRTANGLGLGLAVANGFVSSLGGSLFLESELDKGTTVKVELPQKIVKEASLNQVVSSENLTVVKNEDSTGDVYTFDPGSDKVHALVVDDEPMNLTVADMLLKRFGVDIATALSGKEAVELCKENDYDIIFMDFMMPQMDGVEAMKQIKNNRHDKGAFLPVIALTANTSSSSKEKLLSAGFEGFLGKPLDTDELLQILRQALPGRTFEVKEDVPAADALDSSSASEENYPLDLSTGLGISYIDTAQGLRYCRDDLEFYKILLSQFASEEVAKKTDLENAFFNRDPKNFEIHAHALKSTSKMIGAASLSEEARLFEYNAKSGALPKEDEFAAFLKKYSQICDEIRNKLQLSGEENVSMDEDDEILEFLPGGGN